MSKQTPAPWVLIEVMGHSRVVGSDNQTVVGFSTRSPNDKWSCNARLIAAAPELLEQCELFKRNLEYQIAVDASKGDQEGVNLKKFTLETITAAIAKAEGKS